jgi:fatty acid desaturase
MQLFMPRYRYICRNRPKTTPTSSSTHTAPQHSHKKHHGNHGHVDNDESWHPVTKSVYDSLGWQAKLGRLAFPVCLWAFPFYLIWGSPGRAHSHYHPHSDLFSKHQRPMVVTSDVCLAVVYGALFAAMAFGSAGMVAKLYWCAAGWWSCCLACWCSLCDVCLLYLYAAEKLRSALLSTSTNPKPQPPHPTTHRPPPYEFKFNKKGRRGSCLSRGSTP